MPDLIETSIAKWLIGQKEAAVSLSNLFNRVAVVRAQVRIFSGLRLAKLTRVELEDLERFLQFLPRSHFDILISF